MANNIICPNCKGKGHVLSGDSVLLTVFAVVLIPLEKNDPDGLTREECSVCDGTGVKNLDDNWDKKRGKTKTLA